MVRMTDGDRRVDDRLQHRRDVEGRSADHVEDVAGRGLSLERLPRFVEQSDVLDRDRRLVREGLHELDLPVGKRHRLASAEDDGTERPVLHDQRCRQDRALARTSVRERERPALRELIVGGDVR